MINPLDDKNINEIIDEVTGMNLEQNDVIYEIENIISTKIVDGKNYYQIKWVGFKEMSWISEDDFIETDLLNQFNDYENNKIKSKEKRCYIYCRTSKRNSQNEISIYDQEEFCLEFAKKHDLNVIGLLRDIGVSAKDMKNQLALNTIFNKIDNYECILVYDVSRFSRSMNQALEKLEYLRINKKIGVYSVSEGLIWNNNSSNRYNFRQILSTCQLYSDMTSEKVKRSIDFRKRRGDYIGRTPYGYKTEMINGVRKLVININEYNAIKEMFKIGMDIYSEEISSIDFFNEKMKTKGKLLINDYKKITNLINTKFKNRKGYPFTWNFVRKCLKKWYNL